MPQVYEISLVLPANRTWVGDPALVNAVPLRVTREGIGYNKIVSFFTNGKPEYSFRNSGIFAYRFVFQTAGAPGGEKIHVIYTI